MAVAALRPSFLHHQSAPRSPPPKQRPATPPRPKPGKLSEACATPPLHIRDAKHSHEYMRLSFLGEGGFARVYEVKDGKGKRLAAKTISKTALQSKKNKTKLYAEIKLHKALAHPNIVGFEDCFEDTENVYMLLELCKNGSMMDLLRVRKRYTPPEVRFFLIQLIGACQYMHTHSVIHRDLKLGNLFLDADMNLKVGDFGLAALIEREGERKKTICGTPNYIAPEVLFDTANGHSFEVDVWSIGVIMYTLLVGRPPFQTKDVKAIYKRIKENRYEFPVEDPIPSEAEDLISSILTPDPKNRPTLLEILDHPFFAGPTPSYIPASARQGPPDFTALTPSASRANMRRLRLQAEVDSARPIVVGEDQGVRGSLGPSAAQQEREFNKAVQPGSPISALLSSARQPLLVGNPPPAQPLLRKATSQASAAASIGKENAAPADAPFLVSDTRERELANQKARIVSGMVGSDRERERERRAEAAELPHERRREEHSAFRKGVSAPPSAMVSSATAPGALAEKIFAPSEAGSTKTSSAKVSCFQEMHQNLVAAFAARKAGQKFDLPGVDKHAQLPECDVFIVSWLDYCNKYGMGYALTDGTVGVYFNDSTSLVLAPGKQYVDYISRSKTSLAVRKNYAVAEHPTELKHKMYLLKHFEEYMLERLYGARSYTFEDTERVKGMVFVQRYYRMKNVIVFKLSNDVVQFNFYDHTKVILSSGALVVTYIDKDYTLTSWSLRNLLASSTATDAPDRKRIESLLTKLRYCRDVLGTTSGVAAAGADKEKV